MRRSNLQSRLERAQWSNNSHVTWHLHGSVERNQSCVTPKQLQVGSSAELYYVNLQPAKVSGRITIKMRRACLLFSKTHQDMCLTFAGDCMPS